MTTRAAVGAIGIALLAGCQVKGWAPDQTPVLRAGACHAHPVRAVGPAPVAGNGASDPDCRVAEDGALELAYRASACVEPRGFRGCRIAESTDVSAFEAGGGVWQVEVCLDAPLIETVNLWYETPGTRKYMPLLSPASPPGCHILFFSSDDACLSKEACGPLCAGGATTAMLPDAALADPSDASTDGGRDAGTACSAFGDVSLTLMSEWCVCPPGDCPSTSQGTVHLRSLTYLSEGCTCASDSDCATGTVCRRDAWPEQAHCRTTPGGCPGVCVP